MRVTQVLTIEVVKAFKEVRNHAVQCFQNRVSEKNLNLVLLQLVQACRYEEYVPSRGGIQTGLREFIIDRCVKSKICYNQCFWFIKLESENELNDAECQKYFADFLTELMDTVEEKAPEIAADCQSAVSLRTRLIKLSNYLKAHKSKVDEKTRVLREEVAKEEGQFNML